jgi:serine protease Do
VEELPRNVARHPPGDSITVTVVRSKQRRDVAAKLDALTDDETPAARRPRGAAPDKGQADSKLGLRVSNAPEGGVRVEDVLEGGAGKELQPGDVIVELNGAKVANVTDLGAAMGKLKPGSTALLKVRRGKVTRFAGIVLPAK